MTWNWQHIISFYYRVAVSFQILEEAVQDDKIIYCQCLLLRFIINWKRSPVVVFKKQTRINKEQEQHIDWSDVPPTPLPFLWPQITHYKEKNKSVLSVKTLSCYNSAILWTWLKIAQYN